MTKICYLSNPIGPGGHIDDLLKRHDNIAVASAWMNYLVKTTTWALVSPSLAYASALDAVDLHSPRALVDQVLILERCDALVQVGGWLSPHMTIEQSHAERAGIPVIDLLCFGADPPEIDDSRTSAVISKIVDDAVASAVRRAIWLPPMDQSDVDALRAAELSLAQSPDNLDGVAVIARILAKLIDR